MRYVIVRRSRRSGAHYKEAKGEGLGEREEETGRRQEQQKKTRLGKEDAIMGTNSSSGSITLEMERRKALRGLERGLETPMLVLAFMWLGLVIIDLLVGLGPVLEGLGTLIWIIFITDAGVRLWLAPRKMTYVKKNWLMLIALALPALRVVRAARALRVLRMARAARGLRLVRVVSSLNRGMRALSESMRRRGFAYIAMLTLLVTLTGAAGMYVFERDITGKEPVSAGSSHGKEARPGAPGGRAGEIVGLNDYGAALWWTAMIMTTMGSDYWPHSPEGRVLCLLLALYAFAMFGYVTAALASYFVGRDAQNDQAELAGADSIERLRKEIQGLRTELDGLIKKRGTVL